jgi:hypothetical protein
VTLAMLIKNYTSPRERTKCERRERESRYEGREERNLFTRKQDSFVCRDGERHPDLLKGGSLRGASLERGSWLVRMRAEVSPSASRRTDDNGCPEDAEEGNVVSMRVISVCTHHPHEETRRGWQRTRPSLGPSTRAR